MTFQIYCSRTVQCITYCERASFSGCGNSFSPSSSAAFLWHSLSLGCWYFVVSNTTHPHASLYSSFTRESIDNAATEETCCHLNVAARCRQWSTWALLKGLTHSCTLTLVQTYHIGMTFAAVGNPKMSPGGV